MDEEKKVNGDDAVSDVHPTRSLHRMKIIVIALVTLVIPLQIFIIGDFYGSGFQTPLFRYQDTMFGSFIVLVSHDIWSVLTGYGNALYALITLLWVAGTWVLMVNVVLLCIGIKDFAGTTITGGKLIMIAGLLFGSSIVVQYGPLLHNASGFSIPLGLPLLVLTGFWMYSEGVKYRGIQASREQ
jgi:hypothetical protein